ncbi:MAG: 50S ribosomal protein L11 methyltransferase [Pygmaiobacter sp.]|nr:50S ribosomal protein L11 methyltransferase [Pygmaiobacter sp.]
MEWKDIKITVSKKDADTAEAIATGVSGGGIYIEDYSDLEAQVQAIAHVDLIEEDLLQKDRNIVAIHLYLSPEQNLAEVVDLLHQRLLAAEVAGTVEVQGIEEADWENGWKAFYHAMTLGRRLAICPSWESIDEPGRAVLRLDPGMAFGTGTHETTALCLVALDELVQGGERLLDIGTGSGILAIAALLLGAAKAEGVDIDPMCVRTAGENAALNGVSDRFVVEIGDLSDKASGQYDLITANIVANAIKQLAPQIPALLAPNGTFIASGIIDEREDEVAQAIRAAGLAVREIRRDNGWVCILANHPAKG